MNHPKLKKIPSTKQFSSQISSQTTSHFSSIVRSQGGQILVEYILLLLIGLTVAHILSKNLTGYSDDPEERGVVIKRWIKIWDAIGKDTPDN